MMFVTGPQYLPSPLHAGSQNIAYGVDFSGALLLETPGTTDIEYDEITAVSATISPSGATITAPSIEPGYGGPNTAVIFDVSGGVLNAVYTITFVVTGTSGQIPVLPVLLRCQ